MNGRSSTRRRHVENITPNNTTRTISKQVTKNTPNQNNSKARQNSIRTQQTTKTTNSKLPSINSKSVKLSNAKNPMMSQTDITESESIATDIHLTDIVMGSFSMSRSSSISSSSMSNQLSGSSALSSARETPRNKKAKGPKIIKSSKPPIKLEYSLSELGDNSSAVDRNDKENVSSPNRVSDSELGTESDSNQNGLTIKPPPPRTAKSTRRDRKEDVNTSNNSNGQNMQNGVFVPSIRLELLEEEASSSFDEENVVDSPNSTTRNPRGRASRRHAKSPKNNDEQQINPEDGYGSEVDGSSQINPNDDVIIEEEEEDVEYSENDLKKSVSRNSSLTSSSAKCGVVVLGSDEEGNAEGIMTLSTPKGNKKFLTNEYEHDRLARISRREEAKQRDLEKKEREKQEKERRIREREERDREEFQEEKKQSREI